MRTDNNTWKQMPRRMLRHRVIQQCARLAFGISGTEFHEKQESVNNPSTERQTNSKLSSTEQVKAHLSNTRLTHKRGDQRLKEVP